MATRYIYVGNYGYCWKLTEAEWREVCASAIRGDGYDLSPYRELTHPPRWTYKDENGRRYSMRNDRTYYEPLDWEAEQFADSMRKLDDHDSQVEPAGNGAQG